MKKTALHKKILVFFFPAIALLYSCENSKKAIDDWTKKVVMREEATGVESLLSQDGIIKAKLTSPLMYRVFADTLYTHFPNNLHCDFFDDSSKVETWLDSRQGKYFENLNKVYLWDSVMVINRAGDTLKCKDLWWDQSTQLFYTEKEAVYRGIGKQLNGTIGLTATQDLNSITFHHPIGTMQVSENGFPK
jgi:LPS export ABC transporter protein LptC